MRKMLYEIDLEKAQGYPGRYLEHFSTTNRTPAYAECRELIAKPGLGFINRIRDDVDKYRTPDLRFNIGFTPSVLCRRPWRNSREKRLLR